MQSKLGPGRHLKIRAFFTPLERSENRRRHAHIRTHTSTSECEYSSRYANTHRRASVSTAVVPVRGPVLVLSPGTQNTQNTDLTLSRLRGMKNVFDGGIPLFFVRPRACSFRFWFVGCAWGREPFYNLHASFRVSSHAHNYRLSPTLPQHQQSWLKRRGEVRRCRVALILGSQGKRVLAENTRGGRIGQVNGWGMPAAAPNTNHEPTSLHGSQPLSTGKINQPSALQ